MTPIDPAGARARGQALRQARLSRIRMIRRRVIAGALSLFVATWLLITMMLVTGHDPALAARTATTSTAASTTNPGTATTSAGTGTTTTSSSGSSGTTSTSNSGTSSVTTQQS